MFLSWLKEVVVRFGFRREGRRSVPVRFRRVRLMVDDLEGRAVPALLTAVGPQPGQMPLVRLIDTATGAETDRFLAYSPAMTAGFQVAMGDINADGVTDIVTAAGAGAAPHVKAFSGVDRSELASFYGFAPVFLGGVNLAVGDVDGDRHADFILGAGAGGDAHLKVISGANGSVLLSTLAYARGYAGGVRVAAGDIDGDGKVEIITSAGEGGGPHVQVFSGQGVLLRSFYAFDPSFLGGLTVGAGDLDGDGRAEIVVGAGPGGSAHVKVFDALTGALKGSFLAFAEPFRGGVTVGVTGDVNRDGKAEIVVTANGTNHLKRFQDNGQTTVASFLVPGVSFGGGGATTSEPLPPNLPPAAVADAATVSAGTVLAGNVLANDTDENGDDLAVVPETLTSEAGIPVTVNADGSFTYDAATGNPFVALAAGATRTDRFRYTVTDGILTGTGEVTVTITGVNEPPVAAAVPPQTVAEGQLLAFVVGASDVDGDALTVTATSLPSGAMFDPATRTFTWTPGLSQAGSYSATFSISDGQTTATSTVSIQVTNVNQPPAITSSNGVTVNENQTAALTVTAADPDAGSSLTYSLMGGADQARFAIHPTTGALTFVSAPNYEAPADSDGNNTYVVQVRVSDGSLTATQTVTVTVANVNETPTITSANSASVSEGQTGAIDVNATDPDAGTTLTYSVAGGADASDFSIDPATGVLTFNVAPSFTAPGDADGDNVYVVQVQVSDGSLTATQTVSITVTNANDPPTFTSPNTASMAENQTAVMTVTATDPDAGTTLTYSLTGGADQAKFAIDPSTGALTFASAPNFEAPTDSDGNNTYVVQVQVSDGSLTATQTITVTVTNVNETPTITSANTANAAENQTAALTVTATDPDAGTTLTYSLVGGADQAQFAIDPSTGVLTFLSAPNFETPTDSNGDNTYVVQVQVSDGSLTATQTITVTVTNVNEAPTITSSNSASVSENQTSATDVNATDPDSGSSLTYSIIGGADQAQFAIDPSTGALTFVSPPNYETPTDSNGDNTYVVQVQVSDGGLTATQTVTVTVTNVAEAPTITSANSANAAENQTAVTTVTATDPDAGSSLTFSITGGADQALFSIDPSTGVLTFQATPNFEAPADSNGDNVYLVQVQVTDGALTATQTITVTVTNVNETPVITSANTANAAENQTAALTVTASDPDAGTTLTYSLTGGADQAKFAIDPSTGALTFVSAPNFEVPTDSDGNNTYIVQVQVSDGSLTATQTVTVTVTNVNEGPAITSANSATIPENQAAALTVTATDPDAGTTLTYSITGGTDQARFAIHPTTGALTFVVAPSYETPTDADANNTYIVQVQVSDGSLTATQTVTITVTDVDEAPVFVTGPNLSRPENQTAVLTVVAGDPEGLPVTYSLGGGADQSKFSIHPTTGALTFLSPPDYENPTDANGDNVYVVDVQVSDGSLTATQTIRVTITNVNDPPVITSANTANAAENQTATLTVTATDQDAGATLTYSITGGADQAKFAIDPSTGALTFLSAPNFEVPTDSDGNNTYIVQVQVSDGSLTATQTITVTVTNVNEAPTITSANSANAAENQTATLTVTATDPDAGSSLTFSLTGGADQAKFAIDPSTGALTFLSAPNYEAPTDSNGDNVYLVQVQVSDGSLTSTQTVAVTVTNVNEGPTITSANSANAAENQTATLTVTATDPDAGATLTYSLTGGADQGAFSIDPSTGALTFQAAPNYEAPTDSDGNNTYIVQVQVSDGSLTAAQTVTVTVTNVNEAPTITSANSANAAENQTATLTVTATDPDAGATLTYSLTGGADQAKFAIDPSTGALTFLSAPNFEAPTDADGNNTYIVQVQVSDGSLTATQTVTVTVTNVAEAPTITSANTANAAENQTSALTITATDPDAGTTLTYSIIGGADQALFAIDPSTGALTFQAAPNYETPTDSDGNNTYIVQVQVSDGALTATQTITVTVTNVNETPTITSANTANAAENQTATLTVTATDPDAGTTLTFSLTGGADQAKFAIDPSTGALTFLVAPNFETPTDSDGNNTYIVQVQVSDGALTATQTITVTVTNVNEAPTITSSNSASVSENQTSATDVNATDPDAGATLTYSLTGGADQALFSIDPSTGVLTFNSPPDFEAPADADGNNTYVVQVQVSDGSLTATQTITVTVTNVNETPTITSANSANAAENQTATLTVTATDPDAGTTLTYSLTGGADQAKFAIDPSTGALTFLSAPNYEAPTDADGNNTYIVQVQVSDGSLTATQTITVTVTNVAEAPVFTSSASQSAAENQTAAGTVAATDPEGVAVTYSLTGGADQALFSIDPSTGVLTFNSPPDFEAPADADGNNTYIVQVQVSDGSLTATQTVTVTVTNVNETPTITSANSANAAENQTAALTVTATDPDAGTTLTYSLTGGADQAKFAIDPSTGALTFLSAPNFELPTDADGNNTYIVQVQVSDGSLTATQTVTVTVTNVNETPTITSSNSANAAENQTATLTVTATDPDAGSSLTYSLVGGVDQGAFSIDPSTGVLTFQAGPNFEAPADADVNNTYIVQVQVSDGALTATQTVTVTVTNVNEGPAITSANAANAAENQTAALSVTATDPDAGSSLTFSLTGGADQAKFAIDPSTGALTFLVAPNFEVPTDADGNNTYIVQVQVSDGSLTATQTITVTVTNVNEVPVAANKSVGTNEDTVLNNFVTATDEDLPAQTLTYAMVSGVSHGSLTFNPDGTFSYTPAANYSGTDSFTFRANDGTANGNTATVTITVANVDNDAPVITLPAAPTTAEDTPLTINGISVADPDAGSGQMKVTLVATNGVLTLGSTAGLTFAVGDGTADASMEFTGTLAQINAAVAGLVFAPAANYNGAASVFLTVEDQGNSGTGGPQSDNATLGITVTAVNDAPTISAPASATTDEDTELQFFNVSVADVDAGTVQVTLTVTNGTLTLSGVAGLSFAAGDGTGDATMTFSGTPAAVNAALNGLRYTPTANYNGAASLAINVSDLGNTGTGGTQTASHTVNLTVAAVNDPPVITGPTGPLAATLGNPFAFTGGNALDVTDVDGGAGEFTVTLLVSKGTLTMGTLAGLTFDIGDGTADNAMQFRGTLAAIRAALATLTYTATSAGSASLSLIIDDNGNTGSGGNRSASHSVAFNNS